MLSDSQNSIFAWRTNAAKKSNVGFEVVFKQHCAGLPPPLSAHEHFGFVDNISQPGLRGRVSEKETDVLTLRQDPDEPNNGKSGQELIWTGEFVFDYPTESEFPDPQEPAELNRKPGPVAAAGPIWAEDGSFLVIRRLRQDVKVFHEFLNSKSNELGINPDYLGAKLVGRWRSGAPVMRVPFNDDPALGANDCANNNFEFLVEGETMQTPVTSPNQCNDQHADTAQPDPKGLRCPFAAHIRKAYPRDDASTLLGDKMNENLVQNRRLLRRGIPFGTPYHPELDTEQTPDSGNRGLMFLCYQTSIVEQFECVQKYFSNDPEFKDKSENGVLQTGHDFIIGQSNGDDGKRVRTFVLPLEKKGIPS